MVSFQCHGCGDVVKKPKLDQHRSRCSTGFDCIDCSKTFKSPAEYKGHTSCISEAEKYQKGLYKGPKTGANGVKSNNSLQPNSSSDKAHTANTPISRQSNAQWNRDVQPTSLDNINGYPGPQHQHSQNGWRNGRDNHRSSDRGRKGNNRQQNRFTGSSASGANDTPLGVSRRSSVDDPVIVNGGGAPTFETGNRADGASQPNPQPELSEPKGNPPKEKRKRNPKLVTDESDIAKVENNSALAQNDDVKEDGKKKRKRKKEVNCETGPETETAEVGTAGSDIKEKEKKEREKGVDDEQAGDKKTKKIKKQQEASDEPNLVDEGDAGKKKRKKEKKRKESNDDEAETMVAKNVEIPASDDERTTKPKKKRKNKRTTDDVAGQSDTPVVENRAEVVAAPVCDQATKKRRKRVTTDTVLEPTATHVDKEERQKNEAKREEEDIQMDTKANLKEKKRKRQEELNNNTTEKKRKHNSEVT